MGVVRNARNSHPGPGCHRLQHMSKVSIALGQLVDQRAPQSIAGISPTTVSSFRRSRVSVSMSQQIE
jgi:hypothetical protein